MKENIMDPRKSVGVKRPPKLVQSIRKSILNRTA